MTHHQTHHAWALAVALLATVATRGDVHADAPSTTAGLRAGLTLSTLTGSSDDDWEYRSGWAVGGYVSKRIGSLGELIVGVDYVGKGTQTTVPGRFGGSDNLEWELDYVELSVVASRKLISQRSFEVGIFVGAAPGINVRDEVILHDGPPSARTLDEAERFDVNLVLGVTGRWRARATELRLTACVEEGMIAIGKSRSWRNRTFVLTLAAGIP